ncbi:MAG: uracil-DNA glycosylase [Candidatus Baltobacteraceae bacterium]
MSKSLRAIERSIVACTRCPELRAYCAQVALEKRRAYASEPYWGKPVPAFGDPRARMMLVGLAPGAHGSNRTGRTFTGDSSGDFSYPALHRAGFASQPFARDRNDGMTLRDCIITAAGRCAPPKNKPTPQQLRNCFPYLLEEFDALPQLEVTIGLGKIGFDAIVRMLKERRYGFADASPAFGHGVEYAATSGARRIVVLGTYHPSRQNTNTGKLTVPMFDAIFMRAKTVLATG